MAGMDWTHIVSRMQAKAPQWIAEDEALQIVAYFALLQCRNQCRSAIDAVAKVGGCP